MMALTALNKNTWNGVLQDQVSKMKLQNVVVLPPDETELSLSEIHKKNSARCMMANIILKSQFQCWQNENRFYSARP